MNKPDDCKRLQLSLDEAGGDAASEHRLATAGLALPRHLLAIDADAIARLLAGLPFGPFDADVAVRIDLPLPAIGRARTVLGDRTAGQKIEIVVGAGCGGAGYGIALHDLKKTLPRQTLGRCAYSETHGDPEKNRCERKPSHVDLELLLRRNHHFRLEMLPAGFLSGKARASDDLTRPTLLVA